MTRYLISFPSSAMDHIPDEESPAVGEAAHAVVQEAMDAGVWVFGGGLAEDVDPVMVAGDGTITAGTYPQTKELNGGFTVLDLPSRDGSRGVGREDRGRLPLRSRDPRVHARPSGGQLIEAQIAPPCPSLPYRTMAWASVLSRTCGSARQPGNRIGPTSGGARGRTHAARRANGIGLLHRLR